MLASFKQVFSRITYVIIAGVVSAAAFTFAVWLPNFGLIREVVFNSNVSIAGKANLLFSLFGSIQTNFSVVSAGYTIAIAVLFGINMALLAYYIRSRQTTIPGSGAAFSIGGLVSGIFGIGCAACGTFILSSLLGVFGAAWVLAFLPLGGEEFGLLGVGLLLYSSYAVSKNIVKPAVCESP